jgi:hypothetical protein
MGIACFSYEKDRQTQLRVADLIRSVFVIPDPILRNRYSIGYDSKVRHHNQSETNL